MVLEKWEKNTKQLSFRVPESTYAVLEMVGKRMGTSPTHVAREMVKEMCEREQRQEARRCKA